MKQETQQEFNHENILEELNSIMKRVQEPNWRIVKEKLEHLQQKLSEQVFQDQ